MKSFLFSVLTVGVAGVGMSVAMAQPTISAVANAASNALPGLPNAAIAEGSLFVGYGSNMGPATLIQASSYPLPTNLSGTSAKVTVNGSSTDAIMVYTSANQIAAVLPSATAVGTGTITVTYNGQTSAPAPITVARSNFGTFSVNQQGSGPGIVTYADYSLVGVAKAANPGETLLIWGTGLGPVTGNEAGGPLPGDLTSIPVQAYVGGKQAAITYRGRSGCCTGLDQIGFLVPSGVAGCNVPVAVQIGNSVSNFTSIAVAPSGRACSDPSGLSGSDLMDIFNKPLVSIGGVSLTRSISQSSGVGGFGAGTTKEDDGSGYFYKLTLPQGNYPTSLLETVSFGACSVTTFSGGTSTPFGNFSIQGLDAGPSIGVSGPSGSRVLPKSSDPSGLGGYSVKLGDTTPGNYLDAGKYTITGTGGADVGSFSATLSVPAALVWTNQDSISAVNRGAGLPITWTGGDPGGIVGITGSNFAILTGNKVVGASFTCTAHVSDGSFTIPAVVLLSLPASGSVGGFTLPGNLSVGTSTNPQRFSATGIDYGFVTSSVTNSKSVTFQ